MVAHDNTVMNATITNATPSADDESTSRRARRSGRTHSVTSCLTSCLTSRRRRCRASQSHLRRNGNSARRGDETIAIGDLPAHALE